MTVRDEMKAIIAQALHQESARQGNPPWRSYPVQQADAVIGGPLRRPYSQHGHRRDDQTVEYPQPEISRPSSSTIGVFWKLWKEKFDRAQQYDHAPKGQEPGIFADQCIHDRSSSCMGGNAGARALRGAAMAAFVPHRSPIERRDRMTIRGFGKNNRPPHRSISRRAEYIEHRILRPFEEQRCPMLSVPGSAEIEEMPIEVGLGYTGSNGRVSALIGYGKTNDACWHSGR